MTKINILFSTISKENTNNIVASIKQSNALDRAKNYTLSVIIFDKTTSQDIQIELDDRDLQLQVVNLSEIQTLEEKYASFFSRANCSTSIDSIQRARIQQQVYVIEHFASFRNAITWQVDDDMLFGKSELKNNEHLVNYSTNYFSKIVELFHQNTSVDAIISPSTYVPPIPSLLYCESQLNAFFNGKRIPNNKIVQSEYHDYYNQLTLDKDYTIFLSNANDKTTIAKDILVGKPITKISLDKAIHNAPNYTRSSHLRGGNFIIFNPEIFYIPHLGFSEDSHTPARRSDMIHANLLTELGFELRDVSYFSLVHNRTFSKTSIESSSKKYFSDMIGALLVSYCYKGEAEFEKRLQFYHKHIKNILNLLYQNIDKDDFKTEIDQLIKLDIQISTFNKDHFINEFERFKKTKEQLKSTLCKLAS